MEKERIKWVDLAKGIGIMLVIMGHTSGNALCGTVIGAFHMALFFFLSGYTFRINQLSLKDKLLKCVKANLIPYFIWSGVTIIGIGLCGTWYYDVRSGLPLDNIFDNVSYMLKETVLGHGYGMLWFLTAMFGTKILMELLADKLSRNKVRSVLTLGVCFGLSIFSRGHQMPYNVDLLPLTFLYCFAGFLIRKYKIPFVKKILPITVLASAVPLYYGISMDINQRWYNEIAILNAFILIYTYLTICAWISEHFRCSMIMFVGRNSLYAFCIHHLERTEISYIWEMILSKTAFVLGGRLLGSVYIANRDSLGNACMFCQSME